MILKSGRTVVRIVMPFLTKLKHFLHVNFKDILITMSKKHPHFLFLTRVGVSLRVVIN
jgi:hypothetical protein